jgi:rod shape-determining protein MreD
MVQEVIWNILRFVVVVALQVFVLNELRLGGFINPWLYLYFILMLPIHIPGWLLLMVAFLTGFTIDVFSNTIGMHTLATVFLAFCRPGVLNFIAPREGYEFGLKPTISHLGIGWFLAYAGSLVFLHHTLLFFVEAFKFSEFFYTLFRVILSGIATMILLVLAQYLTYRKKGDTL